MSLPLLFHYLMLNMFRMLIRPSSGACDLFVELFHGLYCSGSMCVDVTLWFGWGGVVSGCELKHYSQVGLSLFNYQDGAWSSEHMYFYIASSVLTKKKLLGLFSYKSRNYRTDVLETTADVPRITRSIKDKNSTGTTRKERLLTRQAMYV